MAQETEAPRHPEDLALAQAWGRHEPQALSRFDQEYRPRLREALLRRGVQRAVADEALQHLSEKLFVPGADGKTKIADYGGRGPLEAWLRTAALRLALNVIRTDEGGGQSDGEALEALAAGSAAPELDYVRAEYRDEFRSAFQTALASLGTRERMMLKLNALEGMSNGQIARVYQVDRSTVKRWLAAARDQLLRITQEELAKKLGAHTGEVLSLVGDLRSAVDLSLTRHLRGE